MDFPAILTCLCTLLPGAGAAPAPSAKGELESTEAAFGWDLLWENVVTNYIMVNVDGLPWSLNKRVYFDEQIL